MLKKEKFYLTIQNTLHREESMHTEIELLYVLEGNLDISVEQNAAHLKADDILVINSNKRHVIKAEDNPLILQFMINYQMACEAFQGKNVIFWCDPKESRNKKYEELKVMLKRLLKHYVEKEDYEKSFGFLADCYLILHHLTANFMVKSVDIYSGEEGGRYEERLRQINQYISLNYNQPISLKDLSEKLFLSIGYLSRFFKNNYGMSFVNYLTNVRILHAVDMILYSDKSMMAVAYDCGFSSVAFFNKAFKNTYGLTPSQFRKKMEAQRKIQENNKQDDVNRKALGKRAEQIVIHEELEDTYETEKRVEELYGEYEVSKTEEFENYWGDTINFGDASNLLRSSIREHLTILQKAIGFKYIRFWSLFSGEFYIQPDQEKYDFNQIDSVLDFVLEQGMLPFIDFGMKPKAICYEAGRAAVPDVIYEDFTVEQWERLMRGFMRHLSIHYGPDILDGWRMELWFDEKLRDQKSEWEKYFAKFNVTYRAVKECNRKIMVGGYGIRMDYGAEQRLEFLKQWTKQECSPDYISIMHYAYDRGPSGLDIYAKRSTDNEHFLHLMEKEIKILQEAGMGDKPIYICDWNLTPSSRNYINDSAFKGAYIIKNIIDMYGKVQAMGYGNGSDREFVSYDTRGILFGGKGLITKEGILKPAAYAFDFMNRLFPYCIGKNKNCLITTDCHDNYGIVCHNQQVLNYNYFLATETEIERDCSWKYFEGHQKLKIQILLKGVRDGQYRVKVYRVNQVSGSVLDIWKRMDYEEELSRNDIKYFKRMCEPHINIHKISAAQGKLLLEEELQMNEIAFIRIRRIL